MRDKRRNTELRAEAGLRRVEMMLMRRRLQWMGHVARMDSTRIPKCVLVCKPEGVSVTLGDRREDGLMWW